MRCLLLLTGSSRSISLGHFLHFGKDTCQQLLDRFGKVLDDMEAIGHFNGLGSPLSHSRSILAASVAADMGDFGMLFHPGRCSFLLTIRQEIKDLVPLQIHQHGAKGSATPERSGKGNGVAAIPSPKNRTGRFLYIRLKPFSPPVSPDAVSLRVNPGYELVDGRLDGATPGSPPDLIPLLISISHDGYATL